MTTIAFAGHGLDRADHLRADPAAQERMRGQADALLLAMDGLLPLLDDEDRLTWLPLARLAPDAEAVFLGLKDGVPAFAQVPAEGDSEPAYVRRKSWEAIARLSYPELVLYGGARSLVDWHARHQFCARCGAQTRNAKGGWQRDCPSCKAQHFPRTDPVVIMLVEHRGKLLLGRGLNFPEGRYSALAGFIEPGESIEGAVAREVLEESGVRVHSVSYIASQPWPFPSQLMVGCHAYTDNAELVVDTTELADARWFTRAEVDAAIAAPEGDETLAFIPPPRHAIAHHMLAWWLERKDGAANG